MKKMLKDNILIKKLVGIETAGSMNILFTDKTGTLTQNKMSVTSTYFNHEFNQQIPEIALIAMGCCQNVKINQNNIHSQ